MAARADKSQAMIEKILATASQLFVQKGYEKTSMQDIARTAGISKGAIYHHFQSKDEIILKVMQHLKELMVEEIARTLQANEQLSGKEQLQALVKANLESQTIHSMDSVMDEYDKDAGFGLAILQDNLKISAPIIASIIKKGMADGSFQTQFPDEGAEVFLLLLNFWLVGQFSEKSFEKQAERLRFIRFMLESIGIDILSDELMEQTLTYLKRGC